MGGPMGSTHRALFFWIAGRHWFCSMRHKDVPFLYREWERLTKQQFCPASVVCIYVCWTPESRDDMRSFDIPEEGVPELGIHDRLLSMTMVDLDASNVVMVVWGCSLVFLAVECLRCVRQKRL